MSSSIKASIAEVKIGHLSLEGLLGSDGTFYVAVPQIAEMFGMDSNRAARDLKRIFQSNSVHPNEPSKQAESATGQGIPNIQFLKGKTDLHPKAVNIISIEQFEAVMIELVIKGNPIATEMARDLVGLSLKQLFCDSFGIKFDLNDRQEFLRVRQESKALFWEFAEQIKVYIKTHDCRAPEFTYYSNAFDALNMALFGKKSKAIQSELGIATGLNRDSFGTKSLRRVTQMQELSAELMKEDPNLKPLDAVKVAIESNRLKPINYHD